jgi:hypothetical protein
VTPATAIAGRNQPADERDGRVLLLEQRIEGRAARSIAGDGGIAVDRGQVACVGALHRCGAVPRVQHVKGRELVAVGEGDVVPQLECVRHAVGGRLRNGGREVGNKIQVVVESDQVVEHVLLDFHIGLGIGNTRIETSEVVQQRELQGLLGGEARALRHGSSSATSNQHQAGHYRSRQGFEDL